MNRIYLATTFALMLVNTISTAAENFQPILPLKLQWQNPALTQSIKSSAEFSSSKPQIVEARKAFESAYLSLSKTLNEADRAKEINTLRASSLKLGIQARILAEMTAARVTAGIGPSGASFGKPQSQWRTYLLAACNLAAKTDTLRHENTVLQALALWRKVEGANAPWTQPPVDLKSQKTMPFFSGVIERGALYDWSKGQFDAAIRKYQSIARGLSGAEASSVDIRILDLEKSVYKRHRTINRWQKALIAAHTKYQDKQVLGNSNESKVDLIQNLIASLHKSLIDEICKEASVPKAERAYRKSVIGFSEKYIDLTVDSKEKERIRDKIGHIYFVDGDHKQAANTFAGLATDAQGAAATAYWRKAIRSQTVLAAWPIDPPWMSVPKGEMEPRETLIGMYKKIDGETAADWATASHVGLLMIANLRTDQAISMWWEKLQKFPTGQHAQRADGWIASYYIEHRLWDNLEAVARFNVKNAVTGLYLNNVYRPKDLLGIALVESGLAALKAQDFKKSVAKFEEYVKGWKGYPKHDLAMYHYSLALYGDQQYRAAILNLESYLQMYPGGKYKLDALVNGGAWALGLAWDEHAIFFLESHSRFFPNDQRTVDSMQTLANLYLGREIYGDALRIMNALVVRKELAEDFRVDLARRMLDVSERNGSPDNSFKLADRVLGLFKTNQEITANALVLKARVYAAKGNIAGAQSIDRIISRMNATEPSIIETIAEVKYLLAELNAKDKFNQEASSLTARDPRNALESSYSQYTKISQMYRDICALGNSSWCGPAYHKIARISERYYLAYAEFTIAKTLDQEEVRSFYDRKKQILEGVKGIIADADAKSLEQAKSGATNPDWTSTILWQNGGDWSHEQFTKETAHHFIQWHTK